MSAGSLVRAATLSAKKMADEYKCLLTQSRTTPRIFSISSSLIVNWESFMRSLSLSLEDSSLCHSSQRALRKGGGTKIDPRRERRERILSLGAFM